MSLFVKEHVTRVFRDAGYELLDIHGDRGGIVQGDGLHLVVTPDIAAAARRFSTDPAVIAGIEKDAEDSLKLRISLYGGSASADLEGVWLSQEFVNHLRDECSEIYYKAQRDVNAIFDAEDAPDREWNGRAYAGVVDEFAMEVEEDVFRVFVRVYRVADQSFNPYGSGDEDADRQDAASIIDGSSSHGTVEVHIFEIDADDFIDGQEVFHPFSAESYDGKDFVLGMAERVIRGRGLIWQRGSNDACTLELAAELFDDEDEQAITNALIERAIARGLPRDAEAETSAAPTSKP
jgi:hypothetical protein